MSFMKYKNEVDKIIIKNTIFHLKGLYLNEIGGADVNNGRFGFLTQMNK